MALVKRGDRVWYWARRKGEKGHKEYGVIIQTDGTFARIRLDGNRTVQIQTIEVKRLQKEEL